MILSEKSRKKPTVSRDEVEEDDEEDEDEEDSLEDHWFRQVQPPKRQWYQEEQDERKDNAAQLWLMSHHMVSLLQVLV